MTYSGASQAREAREALGKALEALQEDPNIPEDVMAVAQNIAQSVGALFEAEKATSEPDGKVSVKSAIGSLGQTLALLQDVRSEHRGIEVATEVIAKAMSTLYPLTTRPSHMPPPGGAEAPAAPQPAQVPAEAREVAQTPAPATGPTPPKVQSTGGPRQDVEVNIGATTESNFYVGFSGEVTEGGVFVSTYEVFPMGTPVHMLVTLPGGFELRADGIVRFVRDPLDMASDAEPGMGVQWENLGPQERELVLRFIRKRPPMFYDE
ncbi:MAG: hypothetical protein ACODAU_03290 [Myxococcota bacterium]